MSYTPPHFPSGLCARLRIYKTNLAGCVEVQCPPSPTEAGHHPSHLSTLSRLRLTYHRWETQLLRQDPAGLDCPTLDTARVVGGFWKSSTACEPPGRPHLPFHHCDPFSFSCRVGADMDLPMIAVIGSQSAGKSSLIESISGITLPRAAGTCTR